MKKTLYLSILLGTSFLAMLNRIYNTFFIQTQKLQNYLTGDTDVDMILSEVALVVKKQHAFATNYFNKALVFIMILSLLISLFYLLQKNIKAVYTYIIYLILTLIGSTYHFIHSNSLATLYSDNTMQSTTRVGARFTFSLSMILCLTYLLIIYINNKMIANKKS